jgi:uncharacterized protein (DUF1330 family)
MAAYVLGDVNVHDPEGYREYTSRVPATLEPFQGRFVVRAGAHELLEGEWSPDRIVLIEFPSMELARAWYASAAYQEILPVRHRNSHANVLAIIEGVPSS